MPTSDKFQKTVNTPASYLGGESPSAEKLSLIGSQLLAAARAFENALGDIRGQRAPYSTDVDGGASAEQITELAYLARLWGRDLTTGDPLAGANGRTLDIVNLARLIGPASNLNPRELESGTVTEPIPAGVHEFTLKYVPDVDMTGASEDRYPTAAAITAASITETSGQLLTYVETLADLNTTGDWILDGIKGVVYVYTATSGTATITYPVDPLKFHGGSNYPGARFNVIPDPNADTAEPDEMLSISGPVDGLYTITLPVVRRQQSNSVQNSVELSGASYQDLNHNQQLKLPKVLDGMAVGAEIPAGFMLLKHVPTGTVYDGATYFYNTSSVFDLSGVELPSVDGADYVLFTVGNDITTAIDDLRIKSKHSHDRARGEMPVSVVDLVGATSLPGMGGLGWTPSEIPSNYFPQYLHRDGYQSGSDQNAYNIGNALRGSLAISASDKTFKNTAGYANKDSFKLHFSDINTYLWNNYNGTYSTNTLELQAEHGLQSNNGYQAVFGGLGGYSVPRVTLKNPVKFRYFTGEWDTSSDIAVDTFVPILVTTGPDEFTGGLIIGYSAMVQDVTGFGIWLPPATRKVGGGAGTTAWNLYPFVESGGATQQFLFKNDSLTGFAKWTLAIWYVEDLQ